MGFERVVEIDWRTARILPDMRMEYGEPRYWGFGQIDGRLHLVAFTVRGRTYRIISFRKANRKEMKAYG